MENKFGKNLRLVRKSLKLTQDEFGKPLNILGSTISAIELGKSKTSKAVIELIEIKYQINRDWLMTGNGDMFLKPEKKGFGIAENGALYNKVEKPLDDDPEISALLNMTKEVLKSKTDYAASLTANIHSFFRSINLEKRVSAVESELSKIKKRVDCCPTGSPESILEKKM